MLPFAKLMNTAAASEASLSRDDVARMTSERGTHGVGSFLQRLALARIRRRDEELGIQLERCEALMRKGDCEPHAFDRATLLLHEAGRYDEEIRLCDYVRAWAAWRESEYVFGAAMWLNSSYKRVMARQTQAESLRTRQGQNSDS